eukprot:PhM_4_TR43/c0_g1_i1/m.98538
MSDPNSPHEDCDNAAVVQDAKNNVKNKEDEIIPVEVVGDDDTNNTFLNATAGTGTVSSLSSPSSSKQQKQRQQQRAASIPFTGTPRTISAMQRLGITTEDLTEHSLGHYVLRSKGNVAIAKKAHAYYAQRRTQLMKDVLEERARLLELSASSSMPGRLSLRPSISVSAPPTEQQQQRAFGDFDDVTVRQFQSASQQQQQPRPHHLAPLRTSHTAGPMSGNLVGVDGSNTMRRVSLAVNQARLQAVRVMEHQQRRVVAMQHKRQQRVERIQENRVKIAEQRKQQHTAHEQEKRARIESVRQQELEELDKRKEELDISQQKHEAMRLRIKEAEAEQHAKEKAEEERKRKRALAQRDAALTERLTAVEVQLGHKEDHYATHKAALDQTVTLEKSAKLKADEEKRAKALEIVRKQNEAAEAALRATLASKEKYNQQKLEKLKSATERHLARRREKQKENEDKIKEQIISHERAMEIAREELEKDLVVKAERVEARRDEIKDEWAERSLQNLLKAQENRDRLTRCRSKQIIDIEERRGAVDDKWKVLEERNAEASRLRNLEVQRRRARCQPEVSTKDALPTPGPGQYNNEEATTSFLPANSMQRRHGPVIAKPTGMKLPVCPTPAPGRYNTDDSVIRPHKAAAHV